VVGTGNSIAGQIGIGTTSPAGTLDVKGSICISGKLHHLLASGGGLGGSGTANFVPLFTGSSAVGNSIIQQALPSGWTNAAIGFNGVPGSGSYANPVSVDFWGRPPPTPARTRTTRRRSSSKATWWAPTRLTCAG